ncbi:unnamed protein product [Gongylonema pulchrum]|uniref:Uncharacterized protein n=1 Tax=Gongylonema pulchrum TaxID=637853 RepID=A0A183DM86_9BILA|nr:unnamed protein product [Gongylonema pulchrum]
MHWDVAEKWHALDALLVQTACCYEELGSGHLYDENKASLISVLSKVN